MPMTRDFYNDGISQPGASDDASHSQLNGGQIIMAQSSCGWRACYGVDPKIGRTLAARDQQLQFDVEHAKPEGLWRPDPSKLRNWSDQLDDPNARKMLSDLTTQGIAPGVFSKNHAAYNQRSGQNYGQAPADHPPTLASQPTPQFLNSGSPFPNSEISFKPPVQYTPPYSYQSLISTFNNNTNLGPVGDRPFLPPANTVFKAPASFHPYLPPTIG